MLIYLCNQRTVQILEYFDDAPDDSANWGKAISSLDEVKDSSDEHSSDSDADPDVSTILNSPSRKNIRSFKRKVNFKYDRFANCLNIKLGSEY